MAAYSFKNFGWFASCVVVALGCYLWTSQVAAERGRLEAIDLSIVRAKQDIRGLETEFQTRANLAQLERWNGDVLALSAPGPQQFLQGETALASLSPGGAMPAPQQAALVVPQGVAPAAAAVPTPAPTLVKVSAPIQTASVDMAAPELRTGGLARTKVAAVAMLDRKLLSDTTLGDLMQSARSEASHLH